MSSKRASEGPMEGDTKKLKQETTSQEKEETVTFKYYPPSSIFLDEGNKPQEMAGTVNIHLATAFYHSRYTNENEARCDNRAFRYDRNAGAVQLYNKDGVTLYKIHGQEELKEYNFVSYGNKQFKQFTKRDFKDECSAYGHSERILMKMVLDDLIPVSAHGDSQEIQRPSDTVDQNLKPEEKEYQILKNLTDNARQYREYMDKKNIIVKMWSERPSCSGVGAGGACSDFIKNICPKGSQFGWTVKNYERIDNQNGAPKVKAAVAELKTAYLEYITP